MSDFKLVFQNDGSVSITGTTINYDQSPSEVARIGGFHPYIDKFPEALWSMGNQGTCHRDVMLVQNPVKQDRDSARQVLVQRGLAPCCPVELMALWPIAHALFANGIISIVALCDDESLLPTREMCHEISKGDRVLTANEQILMCAIDVDHSGVYILGQGEADELACPCDSVVPCLLTKPMLKGMRLRRDDKVVYDHDWLAGIPARN